MERQQKTFMSLPPPPLPRCVTSPRPHFTVISLDSESVTSPGCLRKRSNGKSPGDHLQLSLPRQSIYSTSKAADHTPPSSLTCGRKT